MTLTHSSPGRGADRRYATAAIFLHWTLAALILLQIALGWIMNEAMADHTPPQAAVEAIHISLGLTILLLVLIRIGVRLAYPPPRLPAAMPGWERTLAHGSHILFYGLMLAMPLTGWALVSLGGRPIGFWGLPWPHLPGVHLLFGAAPSKPTRHALSHVHVFILIWVVILNFALHVAGAVKHQFDGRPVLWRMLPFKSDACGL